MGFLDYFKRSTKSATVAKDRLQIIVARERTATRPAAIDYLPQLQQELLQVIAKYELIDLGQVSVNVDKSGGCEVLELNVVLAPPKPKPSEATPPADADKPLAPATS
ncbi:MAG TPA: cell division topological specificity factor MinE [Polyangia bacterium]|jgi:cell division topological specificity factor